MIVVFALVLALLTFWLHRRLTVATALPRPWSHIVDAALGLFYVLAVLGMATGRILDPAWFRIPAWIGLTWLAVVLYLVLGLLIVGIGSLLWRLVSRLTTRGRSTRLTAVRAATAVVVVAAVATTGYGVIEANNPKVSHTTVTIDALPAQFSGVRVAVISDLHIGPARGRGFTEKVVDLVNSEQPDMIAIAGDVTDGTVAEVGPDIAPLAQLSAPLGVFGVTGNHEFYSDDGGAWLDEWERLGIATLRNQHTRVARDGAEITVAGIHDYTAPSPYEPDLAAALQGSPSDGFTLLLAHEPRQAEQASELGVDLQVSGHTHGGQIWPIRYLVPLQQPSVAGLDRIGNTRIYTTRGAGAWGPPVRVGAPPEITILELRSGS